MQTKQLLLILESVAEDLALVDELTSDGEIASAKIIVKQSDTRLREIMPELEFIEKMDEPLGKIRGWIKRQGGNIK